MNPKRRQSRHADHGIVIWLAMVFTAEIMLLGLLMVTYGVPP